MRKNILILFLFACFTCEVFAQMPLIKRLPRKQEKYFVSGGYGIGSALWNSTFSNAELYDKNGGVMNSGELELKAKNSTVNYDFNVAFPIYKIRIGLGICFEEFLLDKLSISDSRNNQVVIFDESFRFDKFYFLVETPFHPEKLKNYSFGMNFHIGYFGHTGVDRLNFFGEEALARTFFGTISFIADYQVFPHTYVYLKPGFEYKLFRNSILDRPSNIKHNIYTGTILAGIRIDISRER